MLTALRCANIDIVETAVGALDYTLTFESWGGSGNSIEEWGQFYH